MPDTVSDLSYSGYFKMMGGVVQLSNDEVFETCSNLTVPSVVFCCFTLFGQMYLFGIALWTKSSAKCPKCNAQQISTNPIEG